MRITTNSPRFKAQEPMFWTMQPLKSAMKTKLGIDATRKLAGEEFKRPWPPLIKMSEEVRRKIAALF